MLNSVKTLTGYQLMATDGEVGNVADFYFDDSHWTIRYLVADTGGWLSGRVVLISPQSLSAVSSTKHEISIDLTKNQIEQSPSVDTDKPVSRQYEETYYKYYGWPTYWGGPFMWGNNPYIIRDAQIAVEPSPHEAHWNSHLRSAETVEGYGIHALDGYIGHISDFIVDEETWAIRYLVIDVRKWWQGRHVLISPHWAERVSWDESNVFVNVTRETIRMSPDYDPSLPITPEVEERLRKYYESYWKSTTAVH